MRELTITPIGFIQTPYYEYAPYQPVNDPEMPDDAFCLVVNPEYQQGLDSLETFRYIYVVYYLDRISREVQMTVSPPWTPGKRVGLFASRSPVRPNPIGISVVRIIRIDYNRIVTSGLDVFNGTPLLDIKPYIRDLDSKDDANYGWIEEMNGFQHLLLHIRGIPHDY